MEVLQNYINGRWQASRERQAIDITNPANQVSMGRVPLGNDTATDVADAVEAASRAQTDWAAVPVMQRVQPLYRLKALLEQHLEELAETITNECGKTKAESIGDRKSTRLNSSH